MTTNDNWSPDEPLGTETFTEEELAALVTRDSMIGVVRLCAVETPPESTA